MASDKQRLDWMAKESAWIDHDGTGEFFRVVGAMTTSKWCEDFRGAIDHAMMEKRTEGRGDAELQAR